MRILLTLVTLFGLTTTISAADYIVIVMDTSGSMADYMRTAKKSRMDVAKEALIEVLSKIPDTTRVGVLTFEGWIYKIAPVDRAKLAEAINGTSPGGGTPLYGFIKQGATELLKAREGSGNYGSFKMLVVTDGEASDNHLNRRDGDKPGVLEDVVSRGIIVDAIGLDMSGDHSLKTIINGSYMSGDDPSSLKKAVAKSVAEVGFDDKSLGDAKEAFEIAGEFSDEWANGVIFTMASFYNQPIGAAPPIITVDEQGNIMLTPSAEEPAEETSLTLFWVLIGIVGAAVVIGSLLLFCKG